MLEAFSYGACLSGTQPWGSRFLIPYANWRTGCEFLSLDPPSMALTSLSRLAAKGAGALRVRAIDCVNARVKQMQEDGTEGRKDMLAKLFTAKHPNGDPYTTKEVVIAAGSILGAGSDTTAITLRAVLRYIVGDKRVYEKVMAEIETAVEEGQLSFPVAYADGTKLSYFQVGPRLRGAASARSLTTLLDRPASKRRSDFIPRFLGPFLVSYLQEAPCCPVTTSPQEPRWQCRHLSCSAGRRRSARMLLSSAPSAGWRQLMRRRRSLIRTS